MKIKIYGIYVLTLMACIASSGLAIASDGDNNGAQSQNAANAAPQQGTQGSENQGWGDWLKSGAQSVWNSIPSLGEPGPGKLDRMREFVNPSGEDERRQGESEIEFFERQKMRRVYTEGALRNGNNKTRAWGYQDVIRALVHPSNLVPITLALGVVTIMYQAGVLMKDVTSDYIKLPTMTKATSVRSWYERLTDTISGRRQEQPVIDDVVLPGAQKKYMNRISTSIIRRIQQGRPLRHLFLYGPPGTGKTMLAEAIGQQVHEATGTHWLRITPSDIIKYGREEGLCQMDKLLDSSRFSSRPVIIIFDECEQLFRKRMSKQDGINLADADKDVAAFFSKLLDKTGKPQPHIMLIGISNLPRMIDDAGISRMGDLVCIKAPDEEQMCLLLERYLKQHILEAHTSARSSWLSRGPEAVELYLAPNLYTETDGFNMRTLQELARKCQGFVGRDINDLMMQVQDIAYDEGVHEITPEILEAALATKREQLKRFKESEEGVMSVGAATA